MAQSQDMNMDLVVNENFHSLPSPIIKMVPQVTHFNDSPNIHDKKDKSMPEIPKKVVEVV